MVHDSEKSNTPFSAIILSGSYDLQTCTLAVERATISRKVLRMTQKYHDEEWETPKGDDRRLFEDLVLDGA